MSEGNEVEEGARARRAAVVAVVGRTNAGKSTLVNRLVGEKVSIVSPVAQTTRNTVRGIVADARGQLVLLDTPGLHKAVGELGRLLNRMARRSAAGADILCVLFDASQPPQLEDIGWMQRIANERPERVVFVLNKADCKPFFETAFHDAWKEVEFGMQNGGDLRFEISDLRFSSPRTDAETASQTRNDAEKGTQISNLKSQISNLPHSAFPAPIWVKCVATREEGVADVRDALFSLAEEGEPLFPEDIVTDYPRRLAIADSIREKFLAMLHQELPHELGVAVKDIDEANGNRWDVKADLLVNRASQKPIVIGRGAAVIKRARKAAERELSDVFGVKVALTLWVRVEPNWMKNPRLLTEMGYLGGEI